LIIGMLIWAVTAPFRRNRVVVSEKGKGAPNV